MPLVICTPPDARRSILRECNHLWRVSATPQRHRSNKGSICRYIMLDFLLKASPLQARERSPQPTAWKGNSANFALTEFSEVGMLRGLSLTAFAYSVRLRRTASVVA